MPWPKGVPRTPETRARIAAGRTPEQTAKLLACRTKHGHSKDKAASPTWLSWSAMRSRCNYPKHVRYDRYGGRGITIDPSWDDFRVFLADMGERPAGRTLDRIDNDGNYTKSNCRWATAVEQSRNRGI